MKRKIIFIVLGIIMMITIIISIMIFQQPSFMLKIDGVMVDQALFRSVMENQVAKVSNKYYQDYGIKIDEQFWQKEIDGKKPLDDLKQFTIDELTKMQASYEYAKQLGIDIEGGIDDFSERLNKINQERKKASENNEVIYGLKEYSIPFYATYEIDRIKEACYELIEISDDEAYNYYESNQDLFKSDDLVKLEGLEIYYGIDEQLFNQYEKIKNDLIEIRSKVKQGLSFKDSCKQYLAYYQEIDSQNIDLNTHGIWLDYVEGLSRHEISEVIDENGCFYLIYVVDRKAGGIKSYDDVKSNIIYQLKKDKVEAQIKQIQDKLTISQSSDLDSFMLSCLK